MYPHSRSAQRYEYERECKNDEGSETPALRLMLQAVCAHCMRVSLST